MTEFNLILLLLLRGANAVQQPVLQHLITVTPTATLFSSNSVHSEQQSKSRKTQDDFPVDVVFTWVEEPRKGSDTWAEIKKSCGTVDMQRYRDYGTLHASLLALQAFIPWVRKVFIVTAGEVPCGTEHFSIPIEIVTHKQIFPESRQEIDLPTHNSLALETHLHRIPGLAEHFIFFDDDMFIGRPLSKSFFFTEDGKAVYYTMEIVGELMSQSVKTDSPVVGDLMFQSAKTDSLFADQCSATAQFETKHQANPFRKSAIAEMQRQHQAFFDALSGQRCRAPGEWGSNLQNDPFWIYMCYHERHGYSVLNKSVANVALLRNTNLKHSQAWYAEVLAQRPSKFCINDDFDKVEGPALHHQKEALAEFLCRYTRSMPNFENILRACPSQNSCSEISYED
mmetsp:Transcript_56151/g.102972  ORF Transcript_56151/g.102972 Transcript_56151/m.102972 type:complete len:396 (-) Transcript_56151:45-1232(-)